MKSFTIVRGALLTALLVAGATTFTQGQGASVDYRRAEQFLGDEVKKLVFDGNGRAALDRHGQPLLVPEGRPGGKRVHPRGRGAGQPRTGLRSREARRGRVAPRSAPATARAICRSTRIRFLDGERTLRLERQRCGRELRSWHLQLFADQRARTRATTRSAPVLPRPPAAGDPPPRADVPSPDKTLTAFVRDHNLWVRNLKTGDTIELSRDGEHFYDYATPLPSPVLMLQQGTEDVIQTPAVFWSPDSTKIATYVMDQRNFPRLTMTQSAPRDQFRPKYFSYAYPLPVDFDLPTSKLVVFDIAKRKQIAVAAKPLTQLYYGGPRVEWTADSKRFMYREIDRGYAHIRLRDVDARHRRGRARSSTRPAIRWSTTRSCVTRAFNGGREVIWSAERDGWNHFYLYDAEKAVLKNQITKGDWVVRAIDHIDETNRVLYFTGAGREAGRDPYLRHAYRVNLDGTGLTLLTPEDADHTVSFSPDGAVLRRRLLASRSADGVGGAPRRDRPGRQGAREEPTRRKLTAMGWTMPEPFKAKAADGKTDLYGLIWRPTNFDPKKKYPVIENIYTGPAERVRAEDVCRLPPSAAGDRRARVHHGLRRRPRHGACGRGRFATSRTRISARAQAATITSPCSSRWRRSIRTWISRASACGGTRRAATTRRTPS